MLVSGPALGAAQILTWSCCPGSCLQRPHLRTGVCPSWALSVAFSVSHRRRACLADRDSAACAAGGEVSGLLPQPRCPWVSAVALSPPLHVGRPLGFAPEAALEDSGLPL